MAEPRTTLARTILEFCKTTIMGHESGMFKSFYHRGTAIDDNTYKMIIQISAANYLNSVYKSLILKDSEYITTIFDRITAISNHSKICLLNIILPIVIAMHLKIERSEQQFGNNDQFHVYYNKHMNSVARQLDQIENDIIESLSRTLSHECHGIDISTCDPNKPLFTIS